MVLSILRSVGSVLAGVAVFFACFAAGEVFSYYFHPYPSGFDFNDFEACKAHVARYPNWVLATGAAIWAVAPFTGAWLATRLGTARHPAHGYIVGAILLAFAGLNLAMLPYPVWFPIVIVGTFLVGTFCGTRLGRGKSTAALAAHGN
jgi:hypothetical protein